MNLITSFKPIIDINAKILILGSIPSVKSLERMQYYGHKQNTFWPIMFELLDNEYSSVYKTKQQLLSNHQIGLWDVLSLCERKGSLDINIKNYQPNDFHKLYRLYPNIQHVYFNGDKAYQIYKSKVGFIESFTYTKLFSTSPAYTIGYDQKLNNWKSILEYI